MSPRAIDHQNPKRKRESYSPEQHDVRRTLRRGRQAPNHIIHDHDTSHDEEDRVEASHHRHSSGQRQSRIVRINVRAPVAPSMSDETNDDPISANRVCVFRFTVSRTDVVVERVEARNGPVASPTTIT